MVKAAPKVAGLSSSEVLTLRSIWDNEGFDYDIHAGGWTKDIIAKYPILKTRMKEFQRTRRAFLKALEDHGIEGVD